MKKVEKEKNNTKKSETKKDDLEVTIKLNKKKLLQGLGIVVLVIGVLGLAFAVSNKSSSNTKKFEFINIDVDEYLNLMGKDEKSIIYVARPGCSWCQKESPIIKRLGAEYNLKIHYLNTDAFFDSASNSYTEAGNKFINSSDKYKEGYGTPNTIIVAGGSIVDGEFSYVERDTLKDLFVRNGFIDE